MSRLQGRPIFCAVAVKPGPRANIARANLTAFPAVPTDSQTRVSFSPQFRPELIAPGQNQAPGCSISRISPLSEKRPSGMMIRHGAPTFRSDSMHRNNRRACTCPAASASWREALQPAPHTRAVTAIDVTELALEIGFLVGHYAVADDERKGHQHYQQPEIVESDGQADQTQEHAEVDGVAREAVRPALDDGGGRQVGGDV